MKRYHGERTPQGCKVTVNNRPLNARTDLWNHSPTGFEWGYGGSGPAQLALALVSNVLGRGKESDERAVRVHQAVKELLVARLPQKSWTMGEQEILFAIKEAEQERAFREHYRDENGKANS